MLKIHPITSLNEVDYKCSKKINFLKVESVQGCHKDFQFSFSDMIEKEHENSKNSWHFYLDISESN